MPSSNPENKRWVLKKIKEINPKTVLDVGTGEGHYLEFIKSFVDSNIIVDGIEVWEPYVEAFNLKDRYDNLFVEDAREFNNYAYDLVILGDVLEHMIESDAVDLWNKISKQAKYAIISIPIIHHPQDAYGGNPWEVHHEEDWNTNRVLNKFHSIIEYKEFEVTGSFVAKF